MAVIISLLPNQNCDAVELHEVCLRLQALGINATTGHNGPFGSIDIDSKQPDSAAARKIVGEIEHLKLWPY